jgi:hypothetical protein
MSVSSPLPAARPRQRPNPSYPRVRAAARLHLRPPRQSEGVPPFRHAACRAVRRVVPLAPNAGSMAGSFRHLSHLRAHLCPLSRHPDRLLLRAGGGIIRHLRRGKDCHWREAGLERPRLPPTANRDLLRQRSRRRTCQQVREAEALKVLRHED